MESHPSMEKLEFLQSGKLRGGELLKILRHLENCDYCYGHLLPQDPDEFLNRLFKKDDDEVIEEDERFEN